ncbi:MAG: dTMP kinase [Gammaproteobacteria bacterium]
MTKRGLFITLEGIEGVGKTTAVGTVASVLGGLGHDVLTTREPGGTELGEDIRALVLTPRTAAVAPVTELLLMFAARAQHLAELIEPALDAGRTVICDRFTDATFAYQGGGRGIDQGRIAAAEALVHPHLQPDLTLLLDAPPEIGLARANSRGEADRFEQERVSFFERVRACYLERASAQPARFRVIDATSPVDVVSASIVRALEQRFT